MKLISQVTALFFVLAGVNAYAKPLDFKEQAVMSKYIAEAIQGLPKNEAGFAKTLNQLSPADQKNLRTVMHNWKPGKDYTVANQGNLVVLSKDGHVVLSLETVQNEPVVILVNGVHKITLDPKDVTGSILKAIGTAEKSASLWDYVQPVMGSTAFASTMISDLAPTGHFLLMYGTQSVMTDKLDYSPWSYLRSKYGEWEIKGETIKNIFTLGGGFKEWKYKCGDGYVTGTMDSVDGKAYPFKQDKDGLVLDGKRHISVQDKSGDTESFRTAAKNYKYKMGEDELRKENIGFAEIRVEDCEKDKCTSVDVSAMVPPKTEKYRALKAAIEKLKDNGAEIAFIENGFQKEHAKTLSEPLHLTEDGELAKTPPANIDSTELRVYRERLRPLYERRKSTLREIERLRAETVSEVDSTVVQGKSDLFDMTTLGRALLAACGDANFKADADSHGMHFTPDGKQDGSSK